VTRLPQVVREHLLEIPFVLDHENSCHRDLSVLRECNANVKLGRVRT
jgi:hypothetical protein